MIKLTKGSLLVYRLFDIGEEIDLRKVESLLQAKGDSRLRLAVKSRDAVVVRDAPVRVSLVDANLQLEGLPLDNASAFATIWNYGTLSVSWHFPFSRELAWSELVELSSQLHKNQHFVSCIDLAAEKKALEISQSFAAAIKTPALWAVSEDYVIFFAEAMEGIDTKRDLGSQLSLAALLEGENADRLSVATMESARDNTFQYSENDLVAIDWDTAFVYEPSGSKEIPDILEFTLTHLLEVRFYDELIDRRLSQLYDSIEESRRRIFTRSARQLVTEANSRYIEFSEFMERMGNSLKVVGDFYLARIFRASVRRFRVKDWEENISRKMELLARVSELLQGEANVRRSHVMEIIIILLILFEIVVPWLKGL